MGIFRRDEVPAAVSEDFTVAGTFAEQAAFKMAVKRTERDRGSIAASFVLRAQPRNRHDPNAILVVWRNFNIGYVPRDRTGEFHPQLVAAKGKLLTVEGTVFFAGGEWRATVNGDANLLIPDPDSSTRSDRPEVTSEPIETWVLTVGDDSADLLDDFDLAAFRRRVARARSTGGRLRVVWEEGEWVETYTVTPDLEILLEREVGDVVTEEYLNGPKAPPT